MHKTVNPTYVDWTHGGIIWLKRGYSLQKDGTFFNEFYGTIKEPTATFLKAQFDKAIDAGTASPPPDISEISAATWIVVRPTPVA